MGATLPEPPPTAGAGPPLGLAKLLDADGRIATDVPCSCGYNLRTLARDGLCPECAAPVAESLARYDQGVGEWLGPVYEALAYLRGIAVLYILLSILLALLVVAPGLFIFAALLEFAAVVMTLVGPLLLWQVTAPPKGALPRSRGFRARRPVRVFVIVLLPAVPLCVFFAGMAADGIPGTRVAFAICAVVVWGGTILPALVAKHVADIVSTFGAAQTARSISVISVALALILPGTAVLSTLDFYAVPVAPAVAFVVGSGLSLYGLHAACSTLRPHVLRAPQRESGDPQPEAPRE